LEIKKDLTTSKLENTKELTTSKPGTGKEFCFGNESFLQLIRKTSFNSETKDNLDLELRTRKEET